MGELSAIFKALADPLRLRIVRLLLRNGKEAYGAQLARALGIPAYQLSRHLKVLKTTGLIHERKEGRWIYYSLAKRNGELLEALRRIIAQAKAERSRTGQPSTLSTPRRRRGVQRRQQVLIEPETFNWDQGPAVPGIL
jgi:ArsR family transcriptional regulator